MEMRQIGGMRVPVLSFGTATFGGGNEFFKAWGNTDQKESDRLVQLCMDYGVNFFDTANTYSRGVAETILGKSLKGIRPNVIISTKATLLMGEGPNDFGSSRHALIKCCEDSLKRLGTDYIDIYHMHAFDANTPVEETLGALETLIQSGKVRYIACSNFSGWHLMKSLSVSERYGWSRYVAHQAYYSLLDREFEWELMPLALDQKVGTIVWSPLASGRLTGKFRRGSAMPADNRISKGGAHGPATEFDLLYRIVDALDEVAAETGKSVSQVALNWLLQRPTVVNLIIGARNEEQLKENLEAVGWNLTLDQVKKLDAASDTPAIYPYWHQQSYRQLGSSPDLYSHLK